MCQLKSMIILKDKIYCPLDHNSHDRMLKELNIEDNYSNAERVFVRAELSPSEYTAKAFKNVDGWKFNVDQDILPEWFTKDKDKYIVMCCEAVKDWVAKRCILDGKAESWEGIYYTFGRSTVTAYDSAMVKAYNHSTVKAWNDATVDAYNNATVDAHDSATVKTYNNTTVTALSNATVTAHDSATVTARNNATVKAYDSSTVKAYGNATVIIPDWSSANDVTLTGNAILVNHRDKKVSGKYVEK